MERPAIANGYAKDDMESIDDKDSKEVRNKKRMKYLLYFIAFVIFQTGVIVLMTLTIMKIRTPRFIIRSASFQTFSIGNQTNPSFNMMMNFQLGVKNTNFGTFNYENNTMDLFYKDTPIGQVSVPRATVLWRSTKKINVVVNVNSVNLDVINSSLGSDLRSGVLLFTTKSDLNGKVKLMQMFKKKKTIHLNCSFQVNTSSQQVTNIHCDK